MIKDIEFVDTDTEKIKTSIITVYESLTQRTLAAGDPVRLFLESIAAIITQQRSIINFTGKMNLLTYAEGNYLDHLGVLVGTERIPSSAAQATVKITLSEAQQTTLIVPQGIRITAGDGIFFQTAEQVIFTPGEIEKQTIVSCTTAGGAGNGYLPGQIKTIVDRLPYVESIVNTTESRGGADIEEDESYRSRIRDAPESFSCAGSDGAYLYFAKTASALITDIAVTSPEPGEVEIIPLLDGGEIPSQEILEKIKEICSDKKVRPLTDHVSIVTPTAISFNITAKYYIDSTKAANIIQTKKDVENAVQEYITWQKAKLGRDINPSELIARMVNAGAKRVNITSPEFTPITKKQVAITNTTNIIFGGIDDD